MVSAEPVADEDVKLLGVSDQNMKANRTSRGLDNNAYAKVVGGLVALLITIIIAVLVYWSASPNIVSSDTQSQQFTGYTLPVGGASQGSNSSAWSVTITLIPNGAGSVNVTCNNATSGTSSYPTFTLAHRTISVGAGVADGFSRVNVSYTTKASADASGTNTMATTVFGLLPIIAVVVIGSILIGLVIVFGGTGRGRRMGRRKK